MSHWENFKRQQSAKYRPSTHYADADHITAIHPPCSQCKAPACTWQRCKCKQFFARCENHQPSAVAEMRRAHRCKETA